MSAAYVSDSQSEFERAVTLLSAYRASEIAYRRAADRATPEARVALLRKAHERARFARELATEVSTMGGPGADEARSSSQDAWPRVDEDLTSLVARTELRVHAELQRSLGGHLSTDLQALVERHARAVGAPSALSAK